MSEDDKTETAVTAEVTEDEQDARQDAPSAKVITSWRSLGIFLLFLVTIGGTAAALDSVTPLPSAAQQQAIKKASKKTDDKKSGKSDKAKNETGKDDASNEPDDEGSCIQSTRVRDRIAKGRLDPRIIASGDLEDGEPYEAVDERKVAYVAYPADESGEYHLDIVRVADGGFRFAMPRGFGLLTEGSSDNPAIKTFIRNDELGITIGIGRGESDETTQEMVARWEEEGDEEYCHSGTRYSRQSKDGYFSGLVWKFTFDDVSGMRHLVTRIPDGSYIFVDVMTEPWPEYERSNHPHAARWIHEFINNVQMLDGYDTIDSDEDEDVADESEKATAGEAEADSAGSPE